MHTRTTAAAAGLLLAGLALAACSSNSDSSRATPTDSGFFSYTPMTVTAAPTSDLPVPKTKLATGAHTAACWKAIRDQYEPGTMQLTGAPTEPPACLGLSTDEVSAVAADVAEYQSGG